MGKGSYLGWPTNNGNPITIGIEAQSDGVSPWPEGMLDIYYRTCAAILWFLGHRATTDHLISHSEYSLKAQGKWDPGAGNGRPGALMDMTHFRNRVQYYIDNPPFLTEGEFTMADIEAIKAHISAEEETTRRYLADFIKGFVGPIGSDVKDVRQQVTGGRDAGQYPGWPQSGRRTLLDLTSTVAAKLGVTGARDTLATSTRKELN